MQYIFIIAVIVLVIAVLFFITNKRTISFDKCWINLIKGKTVKADKNFVFQKDGELIIDGKKKLNFIKAISNNSAVYSHSDYINKFIESLLSSFNISYPLCSSIIFYKLLSDYVNLIIKKVNINVSMRYFLKNFRFIKCHR